MAQRVLTRTSISVSVSAYVTSAHVHTCARSYFVCISKRHPVYRIACSACSAVCKTYSIQCSICTPQCSHATHIVRGVVAGARQGTQGRYKGTQAHACDSCGVDKPRSSTPDPDQAPRSSQTHSPLLFAGRGSRIDSGTERAGSTTSPDRICSRASFHDPA